MKKLIPVVVLLCSVSCSSMKGKATGDQSQHGAMTQEQMQKAFEKAATPTSQHRALDNLVGHYTTETKMWMKPGDAPEVTTGTADFAWMLDGRFMEQKFIGQFQGQPFTGGGLIGYDTIGEKYQSTWQDSMSTQIMSTAGTADQSGKVISFNGEFSCPMSETKRVISRSVLTIGTDSHLYEMYVNGMDGKEFKTLEVTYARAKKGLLKKGKFKGKKKK